MKLGHCEQDFVQHLLRNGARTGYERLLRDCMAATPRSSSVRTWSKPAGVVIQPILDVWHALPHRIPNSRRVRGAPSRPRNCSNAMGAPGAALKKTNSTSASAVPPRIEQESTSRWFAWTARFES